MKLLLNILLVQIDVSKSEVVAKREIGATSHSDIILVEGASSVADDAPDGVTLDLSASGLGREEKGGEKENRLIIYIFYIYLLD